MALVGQRRGVLSGEARGLEEVDDREQLVASELERRRGQEQQCVEALIEDAHQRAVDRRGGGLQVVRLVDDHEPGIGESAPTDQPSYLLNRGPHVVLQPALAVAVTLKQRGERLQRRLVERLPMGPRGPEISAVVRESEGP